LVCRSLSGAERRLVGAGVEGLHLPRHGLGERCLAQIAPGARLVIEVLLAVDPTHQAGGIANLELFDVGGNLPDRQADAAVGGAVWLGAMHQLDMMQLFRPV
jgi:hypothetical protein